MDLDINARTTAILLAGSAHRGSISSSGSAADDDGDGDRCHAAGLRNPGLLRVDDGADAAVGPGDFRGQHLAEVNL